VTLTSDVGRILARLHQVQPKGDISFLTAVKVAHVSIALSIKSRYTVKPVNSNPAK
jgi:hypothetical protein